MHTLPTTIIRLLEPFAPLFSKRVFQHVQVLVAGAILAPGRSTVKELWAYATFYGSPADTETVKVSKAFMERLTDALCYAA